MPRKLAAQELFDYAVKCLAVRAWSTADLTFRLRTRAADAADVDATIDRLKSIGYLDDLRFAENFASSRVQNEGFGRGRIINDLRARRISAPLAEEAAGRALEGKTEEELIASWIERRMPSLAGTAAIEDERKLAAAYRRLRRAGFSSGPVMAALKNVAAQPELMEEPLEEEPEE